MTYENGRRKLVIGETYTIYKGYDPTQGLYIGVDKDDSRKHVFTTMTGETYVYNSQLKSLNLSS